MFYTGAVIIGNFNTTNLIERSFNYRVISLDPSITFSGDVAGTVYVHDFEEIEGGEVVVCWNSPRETLSWDIMVKATPRSFSGSISMDVK
jgi:hypothetical protein